MERLPLINYRLGKRLNFSKRLRKTVKEFIIHELQKKIMHSDYLKSTYFLLCLKKREKMKIIDVSLYKVTTYFVLPETACFLVVDPASYLFSTLLKMLLTIKIFASKPSNSVLDLYFVLEASAMAFLLMCELRMQ